VATPPCSCAYSFPSYVAEAKGVRRAKKGEVRCFGLIVSLRTLYAHLWCNSLAGVVWPRLLAPHFVPTDSTLIIILPYDTPRLRTIKVTIDSFRVAPIEEDTPLLPFKRRFGISQSHCGRCPSQGLLRVKGLVVRYTTNYLFRPELCLIIG